MAKRLKQQRRGKGTSVFRAKGKYDTRLRKLDDAERSGIIKGEVIDLLHDNGRNAPVMLIKYENGEKVYLPAIYRIAVGDTVFAGAGAPVQPGNVLPLKDIPDGTEISDIELTPGDGGKIVRAAGSFAKVVSHESGKVIVRLPSKAFKVLNENCRAVIGRIGGSGISDKPLMKAGNHYYKAKARGKYWPKVSGVKMNANNHPFGGKRRRTGRIVKSTSRNAPPGRKVGSIASKRTGRRKR